MNRKSIARNSVVVCMLTLLWAAPSWAVPVNITAITTHPSWNQIHNGTTGGGTTIYTPLVGTLMGDRDYIYDGWRLRNIMGTLTDNSGANQGVITITDGFLHDGPGEYAHGYFDYSISGGTKDGVSGRFEFSRYESSNYLTETSLRLWGGDTSNYIGMDFKAEITEKPDPVPEPASVILLGSGLLGLAAWRYRKSRG